MSYYRKYHVPDCLYETDNDEEIPCLDANMQATYPELPVSGWGRMNSSWIRKAGTIHFYVEDHKIQPLLTYPDLLLNTDCKIAVEPNFSLGPQTPLAYGKFFIYMKRFISRFWQSHGVKIYVDLSVDDKFSDLNMLGVPLGWGAFACRGYQGNTVESIREKYFKAVSWSMDRSCYFLVYGGGPDIKRAAMRYGWLWIPEDSHVYANKRKDKKTQEQMSVLTIPKPIRRQYDS
jgi:hypothetical protein